MNIVVQISKAKNEVTALVNHMISDYGFPSVIIEGILNGVLADVRGQEAQELAAELQRVEQSKEAEENGTP